MRLFMLAVFTAIVQTSACFRLLIYILGATDVRWPHNPLGIFCFCAAITHFGSASTHIYPDNVALVRSSPCLLCAGTLSDLVCPSKAAMMHGPAMLALCPMPSCMLPEARM